MSKPAFAGLFSLILLGALLFRVTSLDRRPMHHDEANQAVKFGSLLEEGDYKYDKTDHHGPSLYYLTLPFAWLNSKSTLASLNENTLRLVPALFGTGILLLLLLALKGTGKEALLFSGIFFALSPAAVYFSRFYIQETLLVFFILGFLIACWRYIQHPSFGWAVTAGFFAGMMYATKETSLIAFGAVGGSLILTLLFRGKKGMAPKLPFSRHISHRLAGFVTWLLVSWLFYSSFFRNGKGFLDSFLSYGSYFAKAGQPEWHSHPWYYYMKMLLFSKYGSGPVWTEALILVLAVIGCFYVFKRNVGSDSHFSLMKFVCFYTFFSMLFFSFIPYKTPWNLLPFFVGFILLAGFGAASLVQKIELSAFRWGMVLILILGIFHLGFQSYRASFVFHSDPQNPYVYAQTSPDFMGLIQRVEEVAPFHPDGKGLLIKVIADPYDTWPLPWYLRTFSRVGYWQEVQAAGDLEIAPVLITSLDKTDGLPAVVEQGYQTEYYGLRPEVLLAVHIRKDIWDRFLEERK
jgi:uncharacterized protein (TIGR03663 family)